MKNKITWVDDWIDAIPEDPYAPCPCGCGKKFRFAIKEGIGEHEERWRKKWEKENKVKEMDELFSWGQYQMGNL